MNNENGNSTQINFEGFFFWVVLLSLSGAWFLFDPLHWWVEWLLLLVPVCWWNKFNLVIGIQEGKETESCHIAGSQKEHSSCLYCQY